VNVGEALKGAEFTNRDRHADWYSQDEEVKEVRMAIQAIEDDSAYSRDG
jgi:hypothetical protein